MWIFFYHGLVVCGRDSWTVAIIFFCNNGNVQSTAFPMFLLSEIIFYFICFTLNKKHYFKLTQTAPHCLSTRKWLISSIFSPKICLRTINPSVLSLRSIMPLDYGDLLSHLLCIFQINSLLRTLHYKYKASTLESLSWHLHRRKTHTKKGLDH